MKIKNSMPFSTLIYFFVLILGLVSPISTFAKDDDQLNLAEKLDNKRQSFYVKKKELLKNQRAEIIQLKLQIKKLKHPEKELNKESDNAFFLEIANEFVKGFGKITKTILFPAMTLKIILGWGGNKILYFLYLITIINCVLFLYFQERDFFIKKKKAIYIIAATLFFLFVSPSLVQANEGNEELFDKIIETEKILKLSPLEREIRLLESYDNEYESSIKITKIKTENPYLQPLETVQTGKWTYYYTLAALYIEADQPGKAIDNLNIMFTKIEAAPTQLQIDSVQKSINYLLQKKQVESASNALDRFLPTVSDLQPLLILTEQLYQYHMDDSAKQALDHAIKIAKDETALIQLSNYFLKKGKYVEASEAIIAAIRKTKSQDKLFELIKIASQNKMENALNQGIEHLSKITKSLEDYFQLSDYLLKQQRVEQSSRTISSAIDDISLNTSEDKYIENYLKAAKLATARGNYTQAIRALDKLGGFLGTNLQSFKIPLSFVSIKKGSLPANEAILFPSLYGSLQQEAGLLNKAEPTYITAAIQTLDQVQDTFQLETGLNDFFYLWQFYKEKNDYKTLEKLDFIYSILENKYIVKSKHDHQEQVKTLSKLISTLKSKKINSPLIIENPESSFELVLSIIFHSLSALSTTGLLVLMLYYCYKYAYQYFKNSPDLKTYAFITNFIENIGWAYCFTLLGLFHGIITILISQYFQIGHRQLSTVLRTNNKLMTDETL